MIYTTDLNGYPIRVTDSVVVTLIDRATAAGKARGLSQRPLHNRVTLAKWLKVPCREIDHAVWTAYLNACRSI